MKPTYSPPNTPESPPDSPTGEVINTLKHHRIALGLTTREVAKHVNISAGRVSDMENHKPTATNPTLKTALKFSKLYKVSLTQLFSLAEEK